MGNDQSRNAEELAFEIKRRRPSDAVAKVNLPSPNSPNKFDIISRRLSAFRSSRPRSSAQLSAITARKGTSAQQQQQQRPSIDSTNSSNKGTQNLSPKSPISPTKTTTTIFASPYRTRQRHLPQQQQQQYFLKNFSSLARRSPRDRRMSVAGDETIRQEIARLDGTHDSSRAHSNSGASSPRRYSRACRPNNDLIEISQATRKMSKNFEVVNANNDYGGLSVAENLKLTSYQIVMVQQSWSRIKTNPFSFVFRELSSKSAVAKELLQKISIVDGFYSTQQCKRNYDQKEHVRLLTELFDFTIQNINGPCKAIQKKCAKIGELHYIAFGTANELQIWDDLGESITQSIAKADAVRGKREAFRAWISIISFLVDSMRAGYAKEFKRRSMSRNSSGLLVGQNVISLATNEEVQKSLPPPTVNFVDSRSPTPTKQLSSLQLIH